MSSALRSPAARRGGVRVGRRCSRVSSGASPVPRCWLSCPRLVCCRVRSPAWFFVFCLRYNTARRAAGCERLAEQPAAAGFIAAPGILLSTPGIRFSGLLHGEVRSKRGFTASLQLSLGAGVVSAFSWPLSEAAELWAILLFAVTPAGAGLWLPTPGALRPRGVQIHHAISLFNYFYSSLCKSNYPSVTLHYGTAAWLIVPCSKIPACLPSPAPGSSLRPAAGTWGSQRLSTLEAPRKAALLHAGAGTRSSILCKGPHVG